MGHDADLPEHGQLLIPTGQLLARIGEIDAGCEVVGPTLPAY
jgi:hypothetical protein